MLSIHDKNYQDFRDVSLFTTVCLKKFPGLSKTCNTLQDRASYRDELDRLINNLDLIKNSANAYKALKPIMSRKYKVINFLKFTDLKISILTKILPFLITTLTAELINEQKIINDKINLIEQCQKRFSSMPKEAKTEKDIKVIEEVDTYFQLKIKEFKEGKNPALQSYYHSTKNQCFDAILKSRRLKQFNAQKGRGAYVSTNIEHHFYGEYAFALSTDAVHSYSAKYFYGQNWKDQLRYDSTWIRVHHDIHLKRRNVAHVTVTEHSKKDSMKARIQRYNLDVPVITIAASNYIADIFDDVGRKHHFPKTWERLSSLSIPPNVVESDQTFAQKYFFISERERTNF